MTLCEDNHEEIVFDGKRCPLCEKIQELESAKEEISSLNKQLEME